MRPLPHPPVMLVTDRRQACYPLTHIVGEACKAGCRWVSLREKDLSFPDFSALYNALLPITQSYGALLSVHASAEIAYALEVQAVHLDALENAGAARGLLGDNVLIGQSCHTVAECRTLAAECVDYALLGPVFPTVSKPDYGAKFVHEDVPALCATVPFPLMGIGGIEPHTVRDAKRLGFAGVAVMGGVMRAENPYSFMRALLEA